MSENDLKNSKRETSSATSQVVALCGTFLDDHKRVRVEFELSDASQKPNVELSLIDQNNDTLAHTVILGVFDPRMHFTLHLGKHSGEKPVWVKALLRTDDNPCLDEKTEQVQ